MLYCGKQLCYDKIYWISLLTEWIFFLGGGEYKNLDIDINFPFLSDTDIN